MTTIRIYNKDRDYLMEIKDKKKLRSVEAVMERFVQLIKLKNLEEEI